MTENFTLTWLFFDFPPVLIGLLRDFCNTMMAPFNQQFSWVYTVLNGILSISEKFLEPLQKLIDLDWLVNGLQEITDFLTRVGNLPSMVVAMLFLVVYGLQLMLLFFVVYFIDNLTVN